MQARWEECDLLSGNGGRPLSVCNFRSGQICDGVELASKQDSGLSDPYVDAETARHERLFAVACTACHDHCKFGVPTLKRGYLCVHLPPLQAHVALQLGWREFDVLYGTDRRLSRHTRSIRRGSGRGAGSARTRRIAFLVRIDEVSAHLERNAEPYMSSVGLYLQTPPLGHVVEILNERGVHPIGHARGAVSCRSLVHLW